MNEPLRRRTVRHVYSDTPRPGPPGINAPGINDSAATAPAPQTPSRGRSAPASVDVGSAESREADRIEQRVRDEAARLGGIVAGARNAIGVLRERTDADYRERGEDLRRRTVEVRRRLADEAAVRQEALLAAARDTVAAAGTDLAPGSAGTPWAETWPEPDQSVPSRYLRVGRIEGLDDPIPALAPLLLESGWYLEGERSATARLISAVLLRIVAEVPIANLTVHVYDPRLSGVSSFLAPLRAVNSRSLPATVHDPREFGGVLERVTRLALTNADLIGTRRVRDLGEVWETEGMAVGDFAVVVVLDYPNGIDEDLNNELIRLAEVGPPRGVNLVVQRDAERAGARGVKPKQLAEQLSVLRTEGGRWFVPSLPPTLDVVDEGAPTDQRIAEVLASVTRAAADHRGPTVPLEEVLGEAGILGAGDDAWSESSTDAVEAVIGRIGRDLIRIALRSENPPHPNLLVGGAVGQGKSNLLLDIIYSLAARYSPTELEMILLDFKQGLEFKRFDRDESGRNWLPHASILSLESNKAFGVAVLQHVNDEMVRRAELFNAERYNSFPAYRAGTGVPMRRLLLIVDEFQVLFDGHDDLTVEAVRLFETIAKQGRAYGIHVLLSSQTVSGITGLNVKGDSIFAQFPLRISLKNTREESEAVLSRGNTAAADLRFRGEVIVNRNLGLDSDGSNERGVVAFAEPAFSARLQADLWRRAAEAGPAREPWVFLGRNAAQWPLEPADSAASVAWIGRPVAVTDEPVVVELGEGPDTGVALVGAGDELAATLLASMVVTAIATGSATRVLVLDGAALPGEASRHLSGLTPYLAEVGVDLTAVNGVAVLDELETSAGDETETLVVALSMHALDLTEVRSSDPDTFEDTTGASLLTKLFEGRVLPHARSISWWPQGRVLSEALSYDHRGVGTYVLLRQSLDELRTLAGVHETAFDDSPRVGVLSRTDDRGRREVVPFAALTEPQIRAWLAVRNR